MNRPSLLQPSTLRLKASRLLQPLCLAVALFVAMFLPAGAEGQTRNTTRAREEVIYPPVLPGGREVVTDGSEAFLRAPKTIKSEVTISKVVPTIDFMFYPNQSYPGKPWSAWGDSLAILGKYYASIGDHLAPGGNAFVYEYDPGAKRFRQLVNLKEFLNLPEGQYTPGKIHGRLDMGRDGWLYFATHRGSPKVTTDAYGYLGDWIIRHHPVQGKTEIVSHAPVPKHAIPASVLDSVHLIFYGGTAPGADSPDQRIQFLAYDTAARKPLYTGPGGPARCMIFARSTGRVYFTEGEDDAGQLWRYDPSKGDRPEKINASIGLRAASEETADGFVYTVSSGQRGSEAILYSFNTKTEEVLTLGAAAVGTQNYITSLDVDPSGNYLYYVPGAHGGSEQDGSPVVQFDVKTMRKKVIAFLHPFYTDKYGCTLKGTFSSAVDPKSDKLYITWNNSRGGRAWDSCVLTVIHIPASERSR
ncbi:MAG: hypothetical protein HY735_31610 [Verrucomicrobia bacterium]|nr:hypothetical protein [Verrucomicrobiota bacterium]